LCSYGLAKYKLSEQTSHTISWKYFFSTNRPSRLFTPGDLVLISGRFVVENSEQCMTIAYATILNNRDSNYEFKFIDIPICIPHCIFSILVNRNPKKLEEFIHFGVKCVEYNSITGSANIKMEMTVFYSSKSIKFKHLEF
ncbi:5396_t:CDS:1, partial [Racocetra persica]